MVGEGRRASTAHATNAPRAPLTKSTTHRQHHSQTTLHHHSHRVHSLPSLLLREGGPSGTPVAGDGAGVVGAAAVTTWRLLLPPWCSHFTTRCRAEESALGAGALAAMASTLARANATRECAHTDRTAGGFCGCAVQCVAVTPRKRVVVGGGVTLTLTFSKTDSLGSLRTPSQCTHPRARSTRLPRLLQLRCIRSRVCH